MERMQVNQNLSDEQKKILFDKGTETPGTGKFLNHQEKGVYTCANCSNELFLSGDKYDSTQPGLIGWPSFDKSIDHALEHKDDLSLGMHREEIVCSNCGGHIGHVFSADDAPSGNHFCVNSLSLDFKANDDMSNVDNTQKGDK